MDKLTAIRSFSHPGYSPARKTRIHNDRWYLVTMQNVEHGQGDYIGLGEGEYTELLPGNKARERRDAHLNHCNRVTEYGGKVFELLANRYGHEVQHAGYFASVADLEKALDTRKADHDHWIAECLKESEMHTQTAANLDAGMGKSIMTADHHRQVARECKDVAEKYKDSFRCDVKVIRG